jgi:glutathione synthase
VTERDRAICARLAPLLREQGLVFAGIDVIGGLLTEVNVTSPTGIREIDALTGSHLAADVIAWVEASCPAARPLGLPRTRGARQGHVTKASCSHAFLT